MQRHELGVVGGAWVLGWQPKRLGSQNGLKGSDQKRRSSGKLTGPQVSTHVFPQIAKLWGSCYGVLISNNNELLVRAFETGCWCWCRVPVLVL